MPTPTGESLCEGPSVASIYSIVLQTGSSEDSLRLRCPNQGQVSPSSTLKQYSPPSFGGSEQAKRETPPMVKKIKFRNMDWVGVIIIIAYGLK